MHRLLVKVLQMKPEKLIRSIAEEVLEKGSKIRWLADLRKTLKELGWGNIYSTVGMELENMSEGQMMDCSVWRAVKDLFLLLYTEIRGGGGAAGRHSENCIRTASDNERERSSENDREDVDREVPVSDISTVILY